MLHIETAELTADQRGLSDEGRGNYTEKLDFITCSVFTLLASSICVHIMSYIIL